MISSFSLRAGRSPTQPGQTIPAAPVTVFVGPNNSGKSRVLSEIAQFCKSGGRSVRDVVLSNVEFSNRSEESADAAIQRIIQTPNPGEVLPPGHIIVGDRGNRFQTHILQLRSLVQNPRRNLPQFCQLFMASNTLMLDGASRINLVNDQQAGDLQGPAQPHLSFQVLFRDDAKRFEVRRIVAEAFGTHFVIDPTNLGQLRIRLSDRAPQNVLEERGIHTEAIQFQGRAQHIANASDGVKAFTGMLCEIMAGDPYLILVDEPEAFLHPSLASKLGQEISRAAMATDKRIFASTHSSSFVMGCINSGAPVNIIRLTYQRGVSTARVLPSSELIELMRNPLLRSTGILNGLFYEHVVVTESDSDRAFYQEINERLLRFKPQWGIPNCLFINAQNKQTVHLILKPLRTLGIPAIGIVDIDVLKEGGANWTNFLDGGCVPLIANSALGTFRSSIRQAMDQTGRDMKREDGVAILPAPEQEVANNLLRQLNEYGLFIVPRGELESWLPSISNGGHGPSWLINVFEKMGEDADSPSYVKPSDDDVWHFMSQLRAWFTDPNRKGIPS